MSNTDMTQEQFFDELDKLFGTDDGYANHLERIKELKEQTDGIMNDPDSGHIQGCNPYEKFQQAMCELNFDENFISEMKVEVTQLKEQNAELKASEQSTMNYWQSKYEFEKDALSKIQDERDKYFTDLRDKGLEITRLKEESDHIQSDLEDEQEEHHWTQNDLQQLKDDLEPLQAMMDMIKDVNEYKDVVDYVYELHGKNLELQEKLEEPDEKLEESDVDWKVKARNKTKILMKYLPDYNPAFYPGSDIENLEECFKELLKSTEDASCREDKMFQTLNKKRKEESDWALKKIAELKESAQSTENYWKSKYENEQSTNKMLNEAIINHSEILDEIRQYLSNFDGDEVEVFDKIVKSTD